MGAGLAVLLGVLAVAEGRTGDIVVTDFLGGTDSLRGTPLVPPNKAYFACGYLAHSIRHGVFD